ncbi:hypothetical protein [Avibacterium paragallinarum]|uniref:hypothetical protein n=1 Tax=Avibacterium paragallinarum TaxID=728 RepID=UPI00102883A3|nr:hypothetical protein [Avibacterium paragallinarum]RZN59099.1 hypothetical protein EIG78_02475 [Avibacterium paragallinarum]
MSYFKLIRRLPIFSDVSLVIIDRIAKSEAQAKAYQETRWRKAGELLTLAPMPKRGFAVVIRGELGGFGKTWLYTVTKTEREAQKIAHHTAKAFPFLGVETMPLNDMRLNSYFLTNETEGDK